MLQFFSYIFDELDGRGAICIPPEIIFANYYALIIFAYNEHYWRKILKTHVKNVVRIELRPIWYQKTKHFLFNNFDYKLR